MKWSVAFMIKKKETQHPDHYFPGSLGLPVSFIEVSNCSHQQTIGSSRAEGAGGGVQGRANPALPGDPGDHAIGILLQLGEASSSSAGFLVSTKEARALLFLSHPASY